MKFKKILSLSIGILVCLNTNIIFSNTKIISKPKPKATQKSVVKKVPDFRNVNWNMTLSQVKKLEKATFDTQYTLSATGTKALEYRTYVNNKEAYLYYYFNKYEKLYKARYFFEKYSNDNDYINAFMQLSATLTQKYGKQLYTNDCYWNNPDSSFRNDSNFYGAALSNGDMHITQSWKSKTTDINVQIYSKDYDIKFFVDYTSKSVPAPKKADDF